MRYGFFQRMLASNVTLENWKVASWEHYGFVGVQGGMLIIVYYFFFSDTALRTHG